MNRRIVMLVAMIFAGALVFAPADVASAATTPTIAIGDASLVEGDIGTRNLLFAVTLSQPGATSVTVAATITAGTATAGKPTSPGADFNNKAGKTKTLTFKVRATGTTPVVKYVSVPVYPDAVAEGDETVHVTLSAASSGWDLGRSQATGVIVDDDASPNAGIEISIGDATIHEGDVAKRAAKVAVTLSAPPTTGDVRVSYANSGKTKTLIFKVGQRAKAIAVSVIPDAVSEPDETIAVPLSNPVGGSVRDGSGAVTIIDDEPHLFAPDAPVITSVEPGPGNAALTVFWNAPAGDGGAPVTGYQLEITRPAGAIVGNYSGNAATVVCGGPGVTCPIRVRAINDIGTSAWSEPIAGTTWRAPDPVGDLVVSGGNHSVHASWSTPSSPGDFPIIDYRIERSTDGVDFDFVEFATVRASTVSCPGERSTCWIRVSARNSAGLGAAVDGSATTWARPGAPTLVSIRRIGTSVGLSWTPPADDGGVAIFDYTGERTVNGGSTWTPVGTVQFSTPTCPAGISCGFRITAVNIVGPSAPSNILTVGP